MTELTWEQVHELAKTTGKPQLFTVYPAHNKAGHLVNIRVMITPDGKEEELEDKAAL